MRVRGGAAHALASCHSWKWRWWHSSGCWPFDEEACEDKARQKYDAAHAKRKDCPPCLDAVMLADNARSDLDDQNGFIYCGF